MHPAFAALSYDFNDVQETSSMKRVFTYALTASIALGLTTSAWSQGGQAGAVETSNTAGTSQGAATTDTLGTANAAARAQVGAGRNFNSNVQAEGQFSATNRGFNPINPAPWLGDAGARQQLGLNDNQFNQLSRAHQDAYTRYNQDLARLNNTLSDEQRMQQIQQLQARFNQDFDTRLNTTFANPQLRQRFNQLNWQFMGPMAFNDAAVRQQLNLTPQQQQQLRRLAAQWQQQVNQLRLAGQTDPAMTQQQWFAFRTRYQNQLGGILTPTQQQSFGQLIGQPYDFPVNLYLQPNPNTSAQQPVPDVNQGNQAIQRAQRPAPRETRPNTLR
jgi:hypothetical protein